MNHRVASLLPSATEIVCAVGAEADLVGISHECDFPESVRHLPALTRARLRPVRSSREIDREVRAVLRDALAVYEIELERLETARPDVIVTQDLCDVCAVSFSDVCQATATLLREPVQIVNLRPTRLDDIWADIARVAEALGRASEGARVVADLKARAAAITRRSLARSERPRVVSIEWLDPVMLGGMWMPELIERAGGVPLVTRPGDHAPTLSRRDLRRPGARCRGDQAMRLSAGADSRRGLAPARRAALGVLAGRAGGSRLHRGRERLLQSARPAHRRVAGDPRRLPPSRGVRRLSPPAPGLGDAARRGSEAVRPLRATRDAAVSETTSTMTLDALTPMLRTWDLHAAIAFYVEVLGFACERLSEEWGWAALARDGVRLMLARPHAHMPETAPAFTGSLYFRTDDVEGWWRRVQDRARVCYPIESFPYGMREFAIYDADGYVLQFGQAIPTRPDS